MRNKNSNIQGRSLNAIKNDFPFYKELLIKERFFFFLKFWMCAFASFFFVGNFSKILPKRLILFMIFL